MTGHPLSTLRSFVMVPLGTKIRGLVAPLLLLTALATTLAACGGKDEHAARSRRRRRPPRPRPPIGSGRRSCPVETASVPTAAKFAFWERRADPTKVVGRAGLGRIQRNTRCAATLRSRPPPSCSRARLRRTAPLRAGRRALSWNIAEVAPSARGPSFPTGHAPSLLDPIVHLRSAETPVTRTSAP
jgi:hypothetical protein